MSPLFMLKRRYKTILLVVLMIIGWFALEAAYMPLPTGDPKIEALNLTYSTQYESVEAFQSHLGTVIFEKIPWDALL